MQMGFVFPHLQNNDQWLHQDVIFLHSFGYHLPEFTYSRVSIKLVNMNSIRRVNMKYKKERQKEMD